MYGSRLRIAPWNAGAADARSRGWRPQGYLGTPEISPDILAPPGMGHGPKEACFDLDACVFNA